MIKRCAGLIDTKDVNEWTNDFLRNIDERTRNGDDTTGLSEKQISNIERIFAQHFGG
jgi:hypothetical protein